jgi:hypothetical protein
VDLQRTRVRSFTRQVADSFYYPASLSKSKEAAIAAIDSAANASETASILVRAAMAGVLASLGHHAQLAPPASELPRAQVLDLKKPSARDLGDMRVISVPQLAAPVELWEPPCRGLDGYFDVPASEHIAGIVLDLRGNEGGSLNGPRCLASMFVKPNVEVFQVADRSGRRWGYSTLTVGSHAPFAYSLAIFIDKKTDSGALLAAAILQDQQRAQIIGEVKDDINGSVSSVFRTDRDQDIFVLPIGELLRAGGRPLANGYRVDVAIPAQDDAALLDAARARFAQPSTTQR